jgi:hypothetical protein
MLMALTEYDTLPSDSLRTDMTASTAMLAKNSADVPMIFEDIDVCRRSATHTGPSCQPATAARHAGDGAVPWRH